MSIITPVQVTCASLPYFKALPLKQETKVLRLICRGNGRGFCRARNQGADPQMWDDDDLERKAIRAMTKNKRTDATDYVKWLLTTADDGRISISPYDTAWVALIENMDGSGSPQFPSSLAWIAENQLVDGSWGDAQVFSAYDRLLNTLACVIALKTWNVYPEKREEGLTFIRQNIPKLESTIVDNMTCGFEIVFPALIERARSLGIQIPYDAPFLKEINALRSVKLARIPKDLMHEVPTALLYNLEGMQNLDWQKILKLRTQEGSFLTSPSSTAFAVMETKDRNCLKYLNDIVIKFKGGAPTVYPVDLFARLWAVDRLERLGISRFFQPQIKEYLNYVHRYWTEKGVFSGRNAGICDLDDTSMGFRLLRLEGHDDVAADVFKHFKYGDRFCCLGGELNESPTTILNLYRASQLQFPGEKILEEARMFACDFLQRKLANSKIIDKWVLSKDILGELRYGLEVPWYASLPRVEARLYIEQYSGANEVWVGKTLYRMPEISNEVYLDLAKLDFNECQAQHQLEWIHMQEWWAECNLQDYGITAENLLFAYFLAAASIFEPEMSTVRLAWAKSWVIAAAVRIYCEEVATSKEQRNDFLEAFKRNTFEVEDTHLNWRGAELLRNILEFIHKTSVDAFERLQRDINQQLHNAWETWLMRFVVKYDKYPNEALLLVHIINICTGNIDSNTILSQEYKKISDLTDKVCESLKYESSKVVDVHCPSTNNGGINSKKIEACMQELVRVVLQSSPGAVNRPVKQTFLTVAKTSYYTARTAKKTVDFHISKVLFEGVE